MWGGYPYLVFYLLWKQKKKKKKNSLHLQLTYDVGIHLIYVKTSTRENCLEAFVVWWVNSRMIIFMGSPWLAQLVDALFLTWEVSGLNPRLSWYTVLGGGSCICGFPHPFVSRLVGFGTKKCDKNYILYLLYWTCDIFSSRSLDYMIFLRFYTLAKQFRIWFLIFYKFYC